MLQIITTTLRHSINVYEGVSPSLLATMSLAVNINGNNQTELVQSLVKANLIENKNDVSAWEQVDRKYFTKSLNPYLNKPSKISKGQKMTDIFTHAIIMNNLTHSWNNNVKVLDIGTGHGFLTFLIAKVLQGRKIFNYDIKGIDINQEAIENCCNIQQNYFSGNKGKVKFTCCDLNQYLSQQNGQFDVIIGGYYLDPSISEKLVSRMTESGVGIWPSQSEQGQALYRFEPKKERVYLMQTLFSMPVVKSKFEEYFISDKDPIQQSAQVGQKVKIEQSIEEKMKMRKQMQEKLRKELKELLEKHRKNCGKILSLQEMKQNPQIKQKLQQLQKLGKTKIKAPSK